MLGVRVASTAVESTCDSCGRYDELSPVVRVYLQRLDDGTDRVVEDDDESWCASCRATYPHRERS